MKTDPNTLAFPIAADGFIEGGLTKREYFAAIALQGYKANSWAIQELNEDQQARLAVKDADALIAALNEEKQ